MMSTSKILSIIAFFLSEFDLNAVHALGYKNRSEAMRTISVLSGRDNNYLKLRRDEFDALPESSSHRKGWKNRKPSKEVAEMGAHLRTIPYDELTEIVKSLIAGFDSSSVTVIPATRLVEKDDISEEELEQIINFSDPDASIEIVSKTAARRIFNTSIIHKLKKLYKGQCQLCGKKPFDDIDVDICEAHHIESFAETQNNDANNIIILCPNHHRLLHKLKLSFDRENNRFCTHEFFLNINLDYHLK